MSSTQLEQVRALARRGLGKLRRRLTAAASASPDSAGSPGSPGSARSAPRDGSTASAAPVTATARKKRAAPEPTRYVFVVSGGRSGSTLLQGLLNALPRTLVRGENGFFVLQLFRAQQATRTIKTSFSKNAGPPTSAFYGIDQFDLAAFARTTKRLMIGQLLADIDPDDVDVLGFKEVRWETIRPRETDGFFRFFDEVFPGALFILNERDPDVVVGSGHWRRTDEQTAREALARVQQVQNFLRKTRPERTFDTTFEVITGTDADARDKQLRELAEFVIGSCDQQLLERLRTVLTIGHGPFPFGRARKDGKGAAAQATQA